MFLGGCYKKKPETFYCRIHYATVHLTRTGANRSIFIMLLVFLARTGSRARFVSAKGLQCNVATRALSIPASIVEIRCLNVVVTNSPRQPCESPGRFDGRAVLLVARRTTTLPFENLRHICAARTGHSGNSNLYIYP